MRFIVSAMILLALAACAAPGPNPADKTFMAATETVPAARGAEYTTAGRWYPGSTLGDMFAFSGTFTDGRFFISDTAIIFTIYEGGRFLNAKEIDFAATEWMTHKTHGVSRIMTFKKDNEINSFLISAATDRKGDSANIDEVIAYVADRVN